MSEDRRSTSSGSSLEPDVIDPDQRNTDHDQRDDELEASSATRIMATSAASGVTARRPPIMGDTLIPGSDGHGAPVFGVPVHLMQVSETSQQPKHLWQMRAPPTSSPHDIKLIIDRLAATELHNHQLQLQLAQTVHAMDHMRQYGSASPSVSMPSQAAPILMGQSQASPAMMLPRVPIMDATLYHSPMPAAASAPVHLPIQMGQNILELEAQQRWMMHQQTNPNPYQQTGSSNHYPSTISAGVFAQEHSNGHGMRSSGIASSGGRFSLSMLGSGSTPEQEFGSLMCHYSGMQNARVKGELYPSLFAKVNAIVPDETTSHTLLHMLLDNSDIPEMLCLHCFPQLLQQSIDEVYHKRMLYPSLGGFLHPSAEVQRAFLLSLLTLWRWDLPANLRVPTPQFAPPRAILTACAYLPNQALTFKPLLLKLKTSSRPCSVINGKGNFNRDDFVVCP
jgi:hypothetical protein